MITEETTHKIYILNIILIAVLILSLWSLISWVWSYLSAGLLVKDAMPVGFSIFFILFTLILKKISKVGHPRTAALALLGLLCLLTLFMSFQSGVMVPTGVVIYALIIFMGGILIGPTQAIIIMVVISILLMIIFYFQNAGIIEVNYHWKQEPSTYLDLIILNVVYFVIAIVSWLSSREINKSFKKAIESEKRALDLADKLKKQNENLELIVETRTKELRENQLKQLMSLNNYAAYGKLSAGLLHDIKNPLTIISLNLDSLKHVSEEPFENKRKLFSKLINKSLLASRTVESIIKSSQNQLSEGTEESFELVKEIHKTLLLLEHIAIVEKIKLIFKHDKKIVLKGYPTKLSRVIANLIINSIDSFQGKNNGKKWVEISIKNDKSNILVIVKDNGRGIREEIQPEIFKPLYSTKNNSEHSGLGLYCSKKIVEDVFKGEITFNSKYGSGSEFIIKIPKKNK